MIEFSAALAVVPLSFDYSLAPLSTRERLLLLLVVFDLFLVVVLQVSWMRQVLQLISWRKTLQPP